MSSLGSSACAPPVRPRVSSRRVAQIQRGRACLIEHIPRPRDLSIAVRIEHLPAPADRFLFVLRLVVHLGVDPAEDGAGQLVEIHRLVRVVVELQVVGGIARVDERELLRAAVIERGLPAAALQREPGGELVGGIAAPRGVLVGSGSSTSSTRAPCCPSWGCADRPGCRAGWPTDARCPNTVMDGPARETVRGPFPSAPEWGCPGRTCCARSDPRRRAGRGPAETA